MDDKNWIVYNNDETGTWVRLYEEKGQEPCVRAVVRTYKVQSEQKLHDSLDVNDEFIVDNIDTASASASGVPWLCRIVVGLCREIIALNGQLHDEQLEYERAQELIKAGTPLVVHAEKTRLTTPDDSGPDLGPESYAKFKPLNVTTIESIVPEFTWSYDVDPIRLTVNDIRITDDLVIPAGTSAIEALQTMLKNPKFPKITKTTES